MKHAINDIIEALEQATPEQLERLKKSPVLAEIYEKMGAFRGSIEAINNRLRRAESVTNLHQPIGFNQNMIKK